MRRVHRGLFEVDDVTRTLESRRRPRDEFIEASLVLTPSSPGLSLVAA